MMQAGLVRAIGENPYGGYYLAVISLSRCPFVYVPFLPPMLRTYAIFLIRSFNMIGKGRFFSDLLLGPSV
jgi:hypothetical protein